MTTSNERSHTDLAIAAFQQAARKVIERAKQTGTPIITSKDGVVVKLDPHTMKPMTDQR